MKLRISLVVILLGGGILRLAYLGDEDLWLDEYFTAWAVQKPTLAELFRFLAGDLTPPLAYLLARASSALEPWLGLEASLRLPNAVAGCLALPLLYALVARRIGRRAGVVAAGLLAVHAVAVQHAREARFYGLMVCLAIAMLLLYDRVLDRWRARDGVALGVCGAALILLHTFAAAFVLSLGLDLLLRLRPAEVRRRRALTIGAATLTLLLLLAPFVGLAAEHVRLAFVESGVPTSGRNLEWIAKHLAGITRASRLRVSLVLFIPLTIVGAVAAVRSGRRDEVLVPAVAIAGPLIALHLFPPRQIAPARYWEFLLPLAILLQLRGVLLLARWTRPRLRGRVFTGLAAALILAQAVPLRDELANRNLPFRAAAAWIEEHSAPGDRVLMHPHNARAPNEPLADTLVLRYYARPRVAEGVTDVFRLERSAPAARTFCVISLRPRDALTEDVPGAIRIGPRLLIIPAPAQAETPREAVLRLGAFDRDLPGHRPSRWDAAFGPWEDEQDP